MFGLFRKKAAKSGDVKWAAVCEKGLVRDNNEDSHLELPQARVFCVADGMGGGDCGELASAWVCKEIDDAFRSGIAVSMNARMECCEAALKRANDRIHAYALEYGFRQMGSTAALFVGDPDDPCRAAVCHIGDSRVYRMRRGDLKRLTRDHTVGESLSRMVFGGRKDCGSRSNPLAHVLTRAVGPTLITCPEWRKVNVEKNDLYLICSDGVHDMLDDERIAEVLSENENPDTCVERLRTAVIEAGAADNFTVVCVKC